MNHTEHPAKTPSPRTGISATLCALLGAKGSGATSQRRRVFLVLSALVVAVASFGAMAGSASASQGLFDFFGHTGSAAGQFAAGVETPETEAQDERVEPGPAGIGVDDATGDIYVADRVNNRVQQFDSEYHLIRAWGIDTIPSGASGTGNLTSGSKEVTTVVTTSKAFIPGQQITGTGIPAGTTIREVITGAGAASKLVLSEKATASGSGVTLTAAGSPDNLPQNETQKVSVKAAANNFKLKFTTTMPTAEGTTANIAFNATAAAVQSALEGLANVGAGNVEVTGAAGGPYTVEFKGRFADTNVAQLTKVAGSPDLTGPPGPTVLIETLQEGAGRFEKCTVATTCQAGAATGINGGMSKPDGLAVNQANQNVYVVDTANNRVDQFDANGNFVRAWGADVVSSGPGNKPEVQSVKVAATSGTFTLTFSSQTTAALPYNATATEVETALNALNSIGGAFGSVSVSGGPGDPTGSSPYQITFGGALANSNPTEISLNSGGLGVPVGTVLPCQGGQAGATLSYEWLAGGVAIGGATSATYTVQAGDAGKEIQCLVKASSGEGASVKASAPVIASPAPAAAPPGPPAVAAPTGTAVVGAVQTCAPGTWSGSGVTFSYRWLRNGVAIGGANASTYTTVAADSETNLQCEVTGTNANGTAIADSANKLIRAEPPVNNGTPAQAPTITGTLSVGNTLTCSNGTWTGATSFGYQWLRNGAAIGGATANTYTTVAADQGTAIQCKVIATKTEGIAAAAVSGNALIAPVPTPTPPVRPNAGSSASGSRTVGSTLTCNAGTWTPSSPAPTFEFQWLRNGVPIAGATSSGGTSSTYTQVAADLDKTVQCQITATNSKGSSVLITTSTAALATVASPPSATATVATPSSVTTTREGAGPEICDATADVCKSGSGGELGGAFATTSEPNGAAIARGGPYAGDLFVADANNARIQIFNSTSGAFVATFGSEVLKSGAETIGKNLCIAALGNVCRAGSHVQTENTYGFGFFNCSCGIVYKPSYFAIDANGAVYVPGTSNKFLQKYSPNLSSEQDFAPEYCSISENSLGVEATGCSQVLVDPHTNDVYVARGVRGERQKCNSITGCELVGYPKERVILRFDSTGIEAPLETMLEGFGVRYINGMAIDASTGEERSGHIYLTVNSPEQRVDVIGEATPPDFEFEPIDPSEVKAHEVTVRATINPNGNSVDTHYQFETLIQGGTWQAYPVPPASAGNGTSPVAIEEVVPNLRANTKYRIRLAVIKTEKEISPEQTFTTPPSGPLVETGEARWSGPPSSNPSLTFFGTVDDKNQAAHYYFEYGTDTSYGSRVPLFESGTYPAAQQSFLARQTVNGLDPNGTYHYRLVARTDSGTTVGGDQEVGPSQSGGRFAEQVSPAEKGLGNVRESGFAIFLPMQSLQAAENGGRFSYTMEYGNSDSTAGGEMLELGTRESSGWGVEQLIGPSTTNSLRATPNNKHGFLASGQGEVRWLSPELDCSFMDARGFVNAETPAADVENDIWHLYLRDTEGNFTMVSPTPLNGNQDGSSFRVYGAKPDCSRVIFGSDYKLLPGMPAAAGFHLYEWNAAGGGELRLVDVRPDGTALPTGIRSEAVMNSVSEPSADRAFFTGPSDEGGDSGKEAVFVRKSHAVTVDASQSQTAVPNTGNATIQMASKDGSHVFFIGIAGLATNSANATGNSLYDYNVDTGVLKDLSASSNASNFSGSTVEGVLGASDDGSYVYFGAKGQLIAGQGKTYVENLLQKTTGLYLSHNGALSYIGTISDKDTEGDEQAFSLGFYVAKGTAPGERLKTRVTPDGHNLLFVSALNQTSYDSVGKREIYRYSTDAPGMACISCRPDGLAPTVNNEGLRYNHYQQAQTYHSRSISADGSRVFFTSPEELAEGGTGEKNAYEWHNGALTLLGREAEVIDASLDGSDVFIRTPEPLVPQDRDSIEDIYDLRTNGGFAYVQKETCDPLTEGSCQGNPPTPPTPGGDPASGNFNGPGNPPASKPKKCKKGQVLRKGKCVKKPHKGHKKKKAGKRAAKHNGGGSK